MCNMFHGQESLISLVGVHPIVLNLGVLGGLQLFLAGLSLLQPWEFSTRFACLSIITEGASLLDIAILLQAL